MGQCEINEQRLSWVRANQIYKNPCIHNDSQEKKEKKKIKLITQFWKFARVPGHYSEGRWIKGESSITLLFLYNLYFRATKELMKERSSA